MKLKLNEAVRRITAADSPTDRELEEFRALLDADEGAPAAGRRADSRTFPALFATLVVALLAGLWLGLPTNTGNRVALLADEIAGNHIAAKGLDIVAPNLVDLREAFAPLGFAVRELPPGRQPGQLEGGRFCSVQTVPAALLRYQPGNAGGGHATVYQALYVPKRHGRLPDLDQGQEPITTITRGVVVELWTSHGLLFAIARDSHPADR